MQYAGEFFDRLGERVLRGVLSVRGAFGVFSASLGHARALFNRETRKVFYRQIYFTGIEAISTTIVIGALLGIVIITQVKNIVGTNPLLIGRILVWTVVRELGPLFAAILIIARSSTAMTSELGAMRAGGEIDSLSMMGISPIDYLIVPRITSTVACSVVLTFYFEASAILGGLLMSSIMQGAAIMPLLAGIFDVVGLFEIGVAFIKSAVFGIIIASASCYQGLRVERSITGIPKATSAAVLLSLTLVIVFDVLITVMTFI